MTNKREHSTVLCYGGICIDNIIHIPYMPTPGVATTPTRQQFQLGGGATLTAVWLASWDISVKLTGNTIGTDAYGQQVLEWLNQYPTFSSSLIQQSDTVETPYTRALVPPNGDRYLIEFGYDTSPMHAVDDIPLDDIDILTVNFYYNNPERESVKLATKAHARGITVIASDILDETNPIFACSDILINSRAVMQKIHPDDDHIQYTINLQQQHGGIVILTDGEHPVFAVDRDGSSFYTPVPSVPVHDTTGAGDAFRAGIVYGQIHQLPLQDSIRLATSAGALQVMRDASTTPPASITKTRDFLNQP
jgi:sugar/nucleoside kinase (ribokinase family)